MAKRIKGPGSVAQTTNTDELLPEVSDPTFSLSMYSVYISLCDRCNMHNLGLSNVWHTRRNCATWTTSVIHNVLCSCLYTRYTNSPRYNNNYAKLLTVTSKWYNQTSPVLIDFLFACVHLYSWMCYTCTICITIHRTHAFRLRSSLFYGCAYSAVCVLHYAHTILVVTLIC